MPAFEWVHVQLHQQKGMISLSPPTICNSARESMEPKEASQSGQFEGNSLGADSGPDSNEVRS
ncbi:hypothetical protein G6O30_003344 [Shigella dysenteriae]|nr:hypothetical protein [Escherichia coli]EFP6925506.1 hypothetical protein [Shigella dysenteriae]EFP8427061.1 hypothetical protein [Shigella dysenteriae]EFP8851013.1 hypothetical protein [Shigella dysenteriae]EFP9423638.1 hypothetical protein [Shigella dysenteriae]